LALVVCRCCCRCRRRCVRRRFRFVAVSVKFSLFFSIIFRIFVISLEFIFSSLAVVCIAFLIKNYGSLYDLQTLHGVSVVAGSCVMC
jgi:hypothetical protein